MTRRARALQPGYRKSQQMCPPADNNLIEKLKATQDLAERQRMEESLRESEDFFRQLSEATFEGIAIHENGIILLANTNLARMFGYELRELIGMAVSRLSAPETRELVAEKVRSGSEKPYEALGLRRDGTRFWGEVQGKATLCHGRTMRVTAVRDISERKRVEGERDLLLFQERMARRQLEQSKWKDQFLAESSRILAESLDYETTLANVGRSVVPMLADWCRVASLRAGRVLHHMTTVADPSQSAIADHLNARILNLQAPEGLSRCVRTGKSILYPEVQDERLLADSNDPILLKLLRALGAKSCMAVPFLVRGECIGGLLVVSSRQNRRYSSEDLDLAEHLADRCSLAIDNACLYREAQNAVRLRDEFLSIASHELRTPLTSFTMQIQLINRLASDGALLRLPKEKLAKLLRISQEQIERFSKLVNDLLDASRIAAGRLALSVESVDLGTLVRDVIGRFGAELEKAGIPIELRLDEPVVGQWDRLRIEQVIVNLLSNAIKYGEGKPIEVSAWTEGSQAWFRVRDRGAGIRKEDQARIFDRFERAVPKRSAGGLGLGLYIVRQIVEAHQGAIIVESQPGQGATFTVKVPLDIPMPMALSA
jgi:PAS domain S-box-containing protein